MMSSLRKAIPVATLVLLVFAQGFLANAVADNSLISTASLTDTFTTSASGAVAGRVTTSNTSAGIPGALVTIVSAADLSQVLYSTTSDENGFYQFADVPSTYDQSTGTYTNAYKVHAVKLGVGEGYSNSFPVESGSTSPANVVIIPQPQTIVLTSSKTTIHANGHDQATIDAYVTDAYGPVADNTAIVFSLGDTARGMGLLSPIGTPVQKDTTITVYTTDGHAKAIFGWAKHHKQSNTITASFADDSTVSESITIQIK